MPTSTQDQNGQHESPQPPDYFTELRDALSDDDLRKLLAAYLRDRTPTAIAEAAVSQFKEQASETPED